MDPIIFDKKRQGNKLIKKTDNGQTKVLTTSFNRY